MLRFTWVENVTADVKIGRLVELFEEHHAGKAEEILTEYLADNPDEDEVKAILAAIREEDSGVDVTYSDVESEEI